MEIQGTIEQILPVESGVSKSTNKEWRKCNFILNTGGQYAKKICITLFGKALDEARIEVGQSITAHVDVSSRSWTNPNTGKTSWFTEVSAYRIDPVGAATAPQPAPQPQGMSAYDQANMVYGAANVFPGATATATATQGGDDLPF